VPIHGLEWLFIIKKTVKEREKTEKSQEKVKKAETVTLVAEKPSSDNLSEQSSEKRSGQR